MRATISDMGPLVLGRLLGLNETQRGVLTLACERQKDAEPFEPITLLRKVIQLDGVFSEDGDPETSCVLRVATDEEIERLKAPSEGDAKRRLQILEYVKKHPNASKNAVCGILGVRKSKAGALIAQLIAEKSLECSTEGGADRLRLASLLSKTSGEDM